MKKTIILLILVCSAIFSWANEKAVIRIEKPTKDQVESFYKNNDVASYRPNKYIDLVLPIEKANQMVSENKGYITQTESQLKNNLTSRDLAGYRNYEDVLSELQEFAATYPEICQLYDIGDTRGKEYSEAGNDYYDVFNHEIWALKISDNPNEDEDEPAIYWMGEHHSREPISTEVVMYATNYVLENYGVDDEITTSVENNVLWVIPIVNPNGHKIVTDQTDVWWRKNIRDNNENGTFDTDYNSGSGYDGVDPNRNYGFCWGTVGASTDPSSPTYHGDEEFSEPEIQAMRDLMLENHFVAGTSYHSYGELVLFPYGYNYDLTAPDYDALQQLAIDMAITIPAENGGNYDPTESWQLYPAMGTTDDYAYGQHGIFAYTIELGTEFIPPSYEVDGICQDNLEAALTMFKRPNQSMAKGIITDAETNEPIIAEVFIEGIDDSEIFREPYTSDAEFGRYYRLLLPGSYNFTFSAFGYESVTMENVEITNDDITELDIQLQPATNNIDITGIIRDTETNEPIPNCVIDFLDNESESYHTNSNGEFAISNLFAYNYECVIYAQNYEAKYITLAVSENQNTFELELANLHDGTFEDGNMGEFWQFGGNQPWILDSAGNNYSIKSGNIDDEQTSSISFSMEIAEDNQFSFDRKISTEANYDYLYFYIDDQIQDEWAGENSWTTESYPVSAGIHTFKWEYVKDSAVSGGSDSVWIDNIIFPESSQVSAEEPLQKLSIIQNISIYPNPFILSNRSNSNISFQLKENMKDAKIEIFNCKGQKVKTIQQGNLSVGNHNFSWNGNNNANKQVASGVYFYQISNKEHHLSKKMILIK